MSTQYTIPTAPAGWYLSDTPSEGALVVPLGHTETDVVRDLADGWRPLLVTKRNLSTGRATARTSEWEARPVVYSSRGGGGWRQGGWWVRFATPRTPQPAPVADAPSYAAVPLADEPQAAEQQHAEHRAGCSQCRSGWCAYGNKLARLATDERWATQQALAERNRAARVAADAADQAAAEQAEREQDEREEAAWTEHLAEVQRTTRPAWLYTNGTAPGGEPTEPGAALAPDAPDTTPRPSVSVFAAAAHAAVAARERHEASCPRCASEAAGGGWCAVWTGLARRASDAQQAAYSALAAAR